MQKLILPILCWIFVPNAASAQELSAGNYVYQRCSGKVLTKECEFHFQGEESAWTITSTTNRGAVRLQLDVRYRDKNALQNARVTLVTGDRKKTATVDIVAGKARVKRNEQDTQDLDVPEGTIVTSAPDWTDAWLLCQRYDRDKGGRQTFPGLWIHPEQPAQRLNLVIERFGTDRIDHEGKKLNLNRFTVYLRGNSAYRVWADSNGRMVKLIALPYQDKVPDSLVLEGYEQPTATLHTVAEGLGDEGFVDSKGIRLHYVSLGQGPLLVLIHGFPDYWYTWRDQMPALAKHFQVLAIDQRGYNKSDQPKGVDDYTLDKLVEDVHAVVKHCQRDPAVIVGHDWGGLVAWAFAMTHPERTDRLIILNLPHPKGLQRELAHNSRQQKASQYARNFQATDAANKLKPEFLVLWVKEAEARKKYLEALKRSSMEGMLNYYKANYPKEPYRDERTFPPVKCPVLMIHGLKDPYLLPGALNDTWSWVEKDLTLITVPQAGHFVHRDVPDLVTGKMVQWLTEEPRK